MAFMIKPLEQDAGGLIFTKPGSPAPTAIQSIAVKDGANLRVIT
jgi:hypothetical protein